MTRSGTDQFVLNNVPHNASLGSAVMEFTAVQRGLDVERLDQSLLMVRINNVQIPFLHMNGPDTTRLAQVIPSFLDAQRSLLVARSIPVPEFSTFFRNQEEEALAYALQLGWPVNVRPARVPGGVTRNVGDQRTFHTAWQRAEQAYDDKPRETCVLVERTVSGRRLTLLVVDDRVVSATSRIPRRTTREDRPTVERLVLRKNGSIIDHTDTIDQRTIKFAIEAVYALPGLAYAFVHVIVPGRRSVSESPLIEHVDCFVTPAAQFPTSGKPRDIAGAIIDHYISNARWERAHSTPHFSISHG